MNKDHKIILVYPDYRDSIFTSPSLPVGLGYIAKALDMAIIEYEVVDLRIDSIDYLINKIVPFWPTILGISMMSFRHEESYDLLIHLKDKFPELKIIAGGPHLVANKEKVLIECSAIDVGVVGEGEQTMIEIVHGKKLSEVQGVLFREGETVKFTGERPFIKNLDGINFPTYEGFKLDKYGESMVLNSSRGCPYKCIFCGAPKILGAVWRKRSFQSMIEEVEYWYNKGYRHFVYNDSNFIVDKQRVLNLCDDIIRRNINVQFIAESVRADHVDRNTLKKMRQAGFNGITFGVESGSDKVLINLKKGETKEQIELAIMLALELKFNVVLFFLIGSPGEDVDDIKESFKLVRKYNITKVYFFNLTPIPGTEFYDWVIKHKYCNDDKGTYPEDNFAFSDRAICRTDVMTITQLNYWIMQARRVELQIDLRSTFQRVLEKICRGYFNAKKTRFNDISWFLSYPVFRPKLLLQLVNRGLSYVSRLGISKKG